MEVVRKTIILAVLLGFGCSNAKDAERDHYIDMMMCEDACEDEANECACGPMPAAGCDVDTGRDSAAMACRVERDRCLEKC